MIGVNAKQCLFGYDYDIVGCFPTMLNFIHSNSSLRTPHYNYRQFALFLGKESPHISSKFNLLLTDTLLIQIPFMVPSVSILTEFDCSLLFMYKSSTQVVYVNSKHPLSQFQISAALCHAIRPLDLIKVENSMSPSPSLTFCDTPFPELCVALRDM